MRSKRYSLLICVLSILFFQVKSQDLRTPFEKNNDHSATYTEGVAFYKTLAQKYPKWLKLSEVGMTDAGYPLHVGVVSFDGSFTPQLARQRQKVIFFVNNAIHPGEPEGVDATMMLVRDYLKNAENQRFMKNIVLVFIPF